MTRMGALQIIKKELYKDTLPTEEVQAALDCLEEYITTPRVKATREALVNIRKNLLTEFVEWLKQRYKGQGLVMVIEDIGSMIAEDLENFLKERII